MHRAALIAFIIAVTACGTWQAMPLPVAASAVRMPDVRTGFRETWGLIREGRYEDAKSRLAYLLNRDPELEDYYLYALGIAQARTGNRASAVTFERLLRDHPRSVWRAAGALELGRLLIAAGRLDEAEPHLTLASVATWDEASSAAAGLERGRLALLRGNPEEALSRLRETRRAGAGPTITAEARALIEGLYQAHPELAPSGGARLDEARTLLEEHEYQGAEKVVRAADPAGEDPEALMVLADALKGQGAPAAAATTLGVLIHRFPDHSLVPRAMFRMGTLYWNQDEEVAAEAVFKEFLRRFPEDRLGSEAMYAVGRIQQSSRRIAAAVATYEQLARSHPRAALTWEARWRVGWLHYRNDRFLEAARAFGALANETKEAAGARYWQARATEALGSTAAALSLYRRVIKEAPASYYAWRAEERLGIRAAAAKEATAPPRLPLPAPPADSDSYHLTRYSALRAAELPALARRELAAVERESPGAAARRFLLAAYIDVDAYAEARRIAKELGGMERLPEEVRLRLRYPLGFWPSLRDEAEKRGLDPLLVAAVIRQESQFETDARSSADARGLMQLLPSTARQEALGLGWTEDPTARLEEPEINLALGTQHLRAQLDRWRGDLVRALAAYNGGAAAVQKWQANYGDLDPDEFVESITYRETREYVKKVLGHYRAYVREYGVGAGPGVAAAE